MDNTVNTKFTGDSSDLERALTTIGTKAQITAQKLHILELQSKKKTMGKFAGVMGLDRELREAAKDLDDMLKPAGKKRGRPSKKSDVAQVVSALGGGGGASIPKVASQTVASMEKVEKAEKSLLSSTVFSMGKIRYEWLSVMFAGMQVWRLTTGFITSLITNYKMLDTKGTQPLSRAMTRLEASFVYLKYSIMEAVKGPLEAFIIWLADTAIWLAELDPGVLEKIAWAIGVIAGISGLAFVTSQVALLVQSLNKLSKPLENVAATTAAAKPVGIEELPDKPKTIDVIEGPGWRGIVKRIGEVLTGLLLIDWALKKFGINANVLAPIDGAFLGLWEIIKGVWYFLTADFDKALANLASGVTRVVLNAAMGIWNGFVNFFVLLSGLVYSTGMSLGTTLIEGMKSIFTGDDFDFKKVLVTSWDKAWEDMKYLSETTTISEDFTNRVNAGLGADNIMGGMQDLSNWMHNFSSDIVPVTTTLPAGFDSCTSTAKTFYETAGIGQQTYDTTVKTISIPTMDSLNKSIGDANTTMIDFNINAAKPITKTVTIYENTIKSTNGTKNSSSSTTTVAGKAQPQVT
jgi:hypothetical protein